MTAKQRWTRALPVLVLAAGFLIPVVVGRDRPDEARAVEVALTYAGRTADEWEGMARRALEAGSLGNALGYIKSAERVEPGEQYAAELLAIRRARHDARRKADLERRFLTGKPARIEFADDGSVLAAYRTTLALPGESLWTLAADAAEAERSVAREEDRASGATYRWWDELTELNGLRELEVGEEVRLPILEAEREALASANRDDMERLAAAAAKLDEGDLASAERLAASVRGAFVMGSDEYAFFGERLEAARQDERAARERELVLRAQALTARADTLSRCREYADYAGTLTAALDALREAEALSEGVQYEVPTAAIERLVRDAQRVRVESDGTVVVLRDPGEPFTEAARDAVEWLLERELERGSAEFPDVHEKTPDQISWAKFLGGASDLARERGIELAAVLASSDGGEIVLPHPTEYFDE